MGQIWIPATHELLLQALGKVAYQCRGKWNLAHIPLLPLLQIEKNLCKEYLVLMSSDDKR